MSKAWKPPSSRPVWIYFEFRSKPSLITVISMDPRPINYLRQNIVFLYPEKIRVSFSLFLSLSVFCYFTSLLIFIKLFYYYYFIYLFSWQLFLFFHVWGCSGMFRNVPASSGMFHVRNFIDALSGKFMYLFQCIRFGSWKVRRLNRALAKALTSNSL